MKSVNTNHRIDALTYNKQILQLIVYIKAVKVCKSLC